MSDQRNDEYLKELSKSFIHDFSTPNKSSRGGLVIDWITLHYTGGLSAKKAVRWLCNREAKASAHYVISYSGLVYQLAPLNYRTWHVGRGEYFTNGKLIKNRCDRSAIGIELVNPGPVFKNRYGEWYYKIGNRKYRYNTERYGQPIYDKLHYEDPFFENNLSVENYWAPYADIQIDALISLCEALCLAFDIDTNDIIGHEDVARPIGRKTDPGAAFPWDELSSGLAHIHC